MVRMFPVKGILEAMGSRATHLSIGMLGEAIACKYLAKKGYVIRERNHRNAAGEIDIVAAKGATLHLIEVKTISREKSLPSIRPEDNVTPSKLTKMYKAAELYLVGRGEMSAYQLDVVTVTLDHATRKAHCTLYEQVL